MYCTYIRIVCVHCSNKISRDGARMISDLLIRNPPMKVLDLSCNRIEDEGAEYLGKAINSSNLTLRKYVCESLSSYKRVGIFIVLLVIILQVVHWI